MGPFGLFEAELEINGKKVIVKEMGNDNYEITGEINEEEARLALSEAIGAFIECYQPDDLKELSESDDVNTRIFVAGHENTPEDVLLKLAKDENEDVRVEVAGWANATNVLSLMIQDESVNVRKNISNNYEVTNDMLMILAKDENPKVRLSVLTGVFEPDEEIVRLLIEDTNNEVVKEAISWADLELLVELRDKHKNEYVRQLADERLHELA